MKNFNNVFRTTIILLYVSIGLIGLYFFVQPYLTPTNSKSTESTTSLSTKLEIISPSSGTQIIGDKITIQGETDSNATLQLDSVDLPIDTSTGRFQVDLDLPTIGDNNFTFLAKIDGKDSTSKQITIIRQSPVPDQQVPQPQEIKGMGVSRDTIIKNYPNYHIKRGLDTLDNGEENYTGQVSLVDSGIGCGIQLIGPRKNLTSANMWCLFSPEQAKDYSVIVLSLFLEFIDTIDHTISTTYSTSDLIGEVTKAIQTGENSINYNHKQYKFLYSPFNGQMSLNIVITPTL